MIYFTLPNFYQNIQINDFLKNIELSCPEAFVLDMAISCVEGNIPNCYLNGGYNLYSENSILYNDIMSLSLNTPSKIQFNCSNININRNDYDNVLLHLILKLNETGSNLIQVSDIEFGKYLKDKYPNYQLVLSREFMLKNPSIEEYNQILEDDTFLIIQIPEYKSLDIDFIQHLNHKNKLDLTISSSCLLSCPNYLQCKIKEHCAQYNFSEINIFQTCKNSIKYHELLPNIGANDIMNIYYPMGIKHYSFAPVIQNTIQDNFLLFFIESFIKEEYKVQILSNAIKGGLL